jgi:hypothetical protein
MVMVVGVPVVLLPTAWGTLAAPAWWSLREVHRPEVTVTNDFASANLGQVKWFATRACIELDENLPYGAGGGVQSLVRGFSPSNNYIVVNLGQLKAVAAPFYARLIEEGYTNGYPWTTNTPIDDADFAVANIGQVKHVFDFDLTRDEDSDYLPDWWERKWFGGITSQTGASDADADGLINSNEYKIGISPTTRDSDGDGLSDGGEWLMGFDPRRTNRDDAANECELLVFSPIDNR